MAIDFSHLSPYPIQNLGNHPIIAARISVTPADRVELDALESAGYYLSDWFWTGAIEFRFNPDFPFQPQSRKRYARVRAGANIPPNEVDQYIALFSCIAGTALVNTAFAAAMSTPITAAIAVGIAATVAVACFSRSSITVEAFKAAISEAYLDERWGAWG